MNYGTVDKPKIYKTIWLNTEDAVVSAERKQFTFNELPLIQIRGKSILKINSITLSGAGLASANNQNWTIKLKNVKFNQPSYYNSDKDTTPTIATLNYDTNNAIQNGLLSLELSNQDINNLTLVITSSDGHGAIEGASNINFHIGLCIEEYND